MSRRGISEHELIAYVDGEVTPSQARDLEARLGDCPSARRRLEELREIRNALSAPLPEVERIDLVESIHKALAAPKPAAGSRPRRRRWTLWLLASTAVATAALFGLFSSDLRGLAGSQTGGEKVETGELRARSAEPRRAESERWANVQVYRKRGDDPPERLGERINAGDGLLFSYTNLGPRPFVHLMIFAVSKGGDVYWFYPDHRDPTRDPTSIRMHEGEADVELPDLIHQRLSAGRLAIYALFTRKPLRVSEVEKTVATVKEAGRQLPLSESAQRIISVEVVP